MKSVLYFFLALMLISCKGNNTSITEFRTGTFETYLDDSDEISIAERNDSIQIETYNNIKDTFAIRWKSNFEYELIKVNPKKGLDSVPFYVKITGVKNNTYTFKANYKGSDFKQKGKVIKIK